MNGNFIIKNRNSKDFVKINVDVVTSNIEGSLFKRHRVIRIFNKFVEVIIEDDDGCQSIEMSRSPSAPIKLSQHIILINAQNILAAGEADTELRIKGRCVFAHHVTMRMSEGDREWVIYMRNLLLKTKTILEHAGSEDLRMKIDDICSQEGVIEFIHRAIESPGSMGAMSGRLGTIDRLPFEGAATEALLIGRCIFDAQAIAFCVIVVATVQSSGTTKRFEISTFRVREITAIASDEPAFNQFEKAMQEETGLGLVMKLNAFAIHPTAEDREAIAAEASVPQRTSNNRLLVEGVGFEPT